MEAKKRCFIAVNLPAGIKKQIFEKISTKFPAEECNVVSQENLHVTLAFLGNLDDNEIKRAEKQLAAISEKKQFNIRLLGTGNFNNRVFWIGITNGAAELKEIATELTKQLPSDDKRFLAHITVARNKSIGKNDAARILQSIAKENFSAEFLATTVDFMESVLAPQGPTYKKLFSVELKN